MPQRKNVPKRAVKQLAPEAQDRGVRPDISKFGHIGRYAKEVIAVRLDSEQETADAIDGHKRNNRPPHATSLGQIIHHQESRKELDRGGNADQCSARGERVLTVSQPGARDQRKQDEVQLALNHLMSECISRDHQREQTQFRQSKAITSVGASNHPEAGGQAEQRENAP